MKRRYNGYEYSHLDADDQVKYCIDHWEEIFPSSKVQGFHTEMLPTMEYEYIDDYILPRVIEEVKNSKYNKYSEDIIKHYSHYLYNIGL